MDLQSAHSNLLLHRISVLLSFERRLLEYLMQGHFYDSHGSVYRKYRTDIRYLIRVGILYIHLYFTNRQHKLNKKKNSKQEKIKTSFVNTFCNFVLILENFSSYVAYDLSWTIRLRALTTFLPCLTLMRSFNVVADQGHLTPFSTGN